MKVLYVNPNINHHKLPFFYELQNLFGEKNVIYATPMVEEAWRNKMGFKPVESHSWLFHIKRDNFSEFERLFINADIVLCSVRSYWKLIEKRLLSGKLTFYFSERWFKEPIGKLRLLYPPIFNLTRIFRRFSKYKDFFILAQGKTAAEDFLSCGIGKNKIFSFGYFTPHERKESSDCPVSLPDKKINILWAGRLIKQKKVVLLVHSFASLLKKYPNIHLTIIGEGPERKRIEKKLSQQCPNDSYSIYNFMPNECIRDIMNQADIYVLPSSGWEGWGAVINEAMTEECAVIGGDRIGAVKSIFDDHFGLKFQSENSDSLTRALETLISDPALIEEQKQKGREIISTVWSAKEAAHRFAFIVNAIKNGTHLNIYSTGPFSIIDK